MSELVFHAEGDRIFYRGVWLPHVHAEPLLQSLKPQPWAAELVQQLEQAIKEANSVHA